MSILFIRNGQQITSKGFQFLLYTPHEQLWDLLLQYLRMAEVGYDSRHLDIRSSESHQERQMDLVEVLSFLFTLSTSEVGRVWAVAWQKGSITDLLVRTIL